MRTVYNFPLIVSGISIAMPVVSQQHSEQESKRPDIVIYMADDLGTRDIGPYNNRFVKTPNLDALRTESMLFHQAFSASPTSVPARSALFTGKYPHKNGAHVNRMPVRDNMKSMVQYFNDEGYQVAIAGKLHVGPREVFKFDYIPGSNRREPGTEGLKGMFSDLYLSPVNKWLHERDDTRPLVLIIADHCTHMTWPLNPEYTNKDVEVPPFFVDTPTIRRLLTRYYTDITKMDRNVGELMDILKKNEMTENTIMMFTADQGPQLPFGKWTLYDYGVQVPLMIRWPGNVAPGSQTDALVSHVDIVPTLLDILGAKIPEDLDGQSFYPVLNSSGKSRREMVFAAHNGDKFHDQSPTRMLRTTKYKYIVNLKPDAPSKKAPRPGWVKLVETNSHAKMIVDRLNERPMEELYDIENDRYEMKNLAHLEQYRDILDRFREEMKALRNEQGDIGNRWEEDLKRLPAGHEPNPLVPYDF